MLGIVSWWNVLPLPGSGMNNALASGTTYRASIASEPTMTPMRATQPRRSQTKPNSGFRTRLRLR